MKYYRIDRREFVIGDVITPSAAFINNIAVQRLEVENLLENSRPDTKPNRNEIVKLFDSFIAAKQYWVLDSNSKFYEVEIQPTDILHRGNYPLIERLAKETNEDIRNEIANQYWNDEVVDDTVAENFVNQATVIRIICDNEKVRKNTKYSMYNFPVIPNVRILEDE